MSERRIKLVSGLIADLVITGATVGILIVANAPTWGWIAAGMIVWLTLKAGD